MENDCFTVLSWFLPYINMNRPRVHMCLPILNPLPPLSLLYPSGLSKSTGFECPASCIKLALIIYFTYDNIHVSNHDGMITHLEPDILECEVKWALESITTNKASGGDGIQLSYLKSWKMMLWKCCTQYASKFGKLSSGQRTGKGQFSFQSQRKAMPKNVQTTAQLHSSHTLAK